MAFQTLRTNAPIYIFHKTTAPRVEIGVVTSVSAPQPKFGQHNVYMPPQDMVVDISATVDGQPINFKALPANADIADAGNNMVITCSRDAVNAEVASFRQNSIDSINSRPMHESIVAGCDKIKEMLNPEYAEKAQLEQKIKNIDTRLDRLTSMMETFMCSAEKPTKKQKSNESNSD